jgi:hypothetical protein
VSAAAGLGAASMGRANLRLVGEPDSESLDPIQVIVDTTSDTDDIPDFDDAGNVVKINHADGSVTISMDGKPLQEAGAAEEPDEWFGNLAQKLSADECSHIVQKLLLGVRQDIDSRKDWIESRAQGLTLLGLKIEIPNVQGSTDGAPVEGMSKVRHPLLLEAVLRFNANARAELLPTDGPVKIRNDDNNADLKEDQLANAYERDMNHYLTAHATEYYPDTDRMLLMLGLGGTTFKKVYFCPLRNRPVSESVDADDIIVNQSAVNLENARRITHRVMMRPSTIKRLQILGVYRDVELSTPIMPELDSVQLGEKEIAGITDTGILDPDRDREIYEIQCELDVPGYAHRHKGKDSGLEIPYVATIDVSSQQLLALTRNYNQDDQELPTARKRYVKFTFVPGFGFYDLGLLHILGNTTNAVTAAWREMLDSGMYANFPGFIMSDTGLRQNTNIFRVPPGGAAQIKTGGLPIQQSIMALPYNTQGMPALMALVQDMVTTGQRVGGTSELQVGEGRADAPVGTTLALIDQAVKVMNSVHKRLHASQAEEFQLLVDVFREHPASFWQKKCKSGMAWNEDKFLQAINNCELVPVADPNTASMGQRVMKVQGLMQLQQAMPNLMDPVSICTAAVQAIGWANPEQFMVPKEARAQPPPQLQEMQAKMQNEKTAADAKVTEANARAAEAKAKADEVQAKMAAGAYEPKRDAAQHPEQPEDNTPDMVTATAKLIDAHTKSREVAVKERMASVEDQNRDQDREAAEREAAIRLASDVIRAPSNEAGKPASVSSVGEKTNKIIADVDRGLDKS